MLILPIDGDEHTGWKPGKPSVFLGAPYAERGPMFSPDGRWVAYQSTETGQDEIYVVAYPGASNKVKISTDGGVDPTWSRTRSERLYEAPDQRIMVVRYQVKGDMLVAERPQVWSEARIVQRQRTGPTRSFDLHPDGDRVAVALGMDPAARAQEKLVIVLNFFDELRRLAPAK